MVVTGDPARILGNLLGLLRSLVWVEVVVGHRDSSVGLGLLLWGLDTCLFG
jgi:hypothetical protein